MMYRRLSSLRNGNVEDAGGSTAGESEALPFRRLDGLRYG